MRYIVIKDQMFVYRLRKYERARNVAHLTLYKNPTALREGKPFKNIEVADWR